MALLLFVVWQYPNLLNELRGGRKFLTLKSCKPSQLTTLKKHESADGSSTSVAIDESTALRILERPLNLSERALQKHLNLKENMERIREEVEEFSRLVEQGRVIRVPEKKLVRFVGPSQFAEWIMEVEVFRRGSVPLRGFVYWEDLECVGWEYLPPR